MTPLTAEPDDGRQKVEPRTRKQKIHWAVMPVCILIFTVTIGFNLYDLLDRHRVADVATQVLESRGGDVIRVVHPGGRRGPGGYVDVMFNGQPGTTFNGQLSRCDLDALNESPPVFTAMAESKQPYWEVGDEPVLGCEPGAKR